jgi:HEAT repeat protein
VRVPSSRRRPYRKQPEDEAQSRRPSSRRRGTERRGVSSRERHELFSDPPEHADAEELDNIGIEGSRGRRKTSRRASSERTGRRVSERGSRRGSQRDDGAGPGRSKREKRDWARRKVRKLVPVGVLAGLVVLGLIATQIPGWIRGAHLDKLSSSNPYIRESAVVNLSEDDAALDGLLAAVQNRKFDEAGGAAATALGLHHNRDGALQRLKTAAASEKPDARASAAYGLGLTRNPEAVEALAKMLAGDEQKAVRVQAAHALGMIKSPKSVEALISQAQSESDVRDASLRALLTAACPEALDQLIKGLGSPTPEMRDACRGALLATGAHVSAADLKKLLAADSAAVRAGAVGFLALGTDNKLFEEMVPKALGDTSEPVRVAAAEAVGLRRWKKGREPLEKILLAETEAPEVKIAAARALGRIHQLESVGPLSKVLANPQQMEAVRLAAAGALKQVANKRHNPFRRPVGSFEEGERASHLGVAMKKPDPRWEALQALVAGCGSFKGEKLEQEGFDAMRALCGRKLARKPDVWQAWMANKTEDAKVLGHISSLVEEAYEIKKSKDTASQNKAYDKVTQAMKLSKALLKKSDDDDRGYFRGLFDDLCRKIGLDPKKEVEKPDAGEPKKEEPKKEEGKKEETEKQD